ncbi:MAG: hypothetical protein K6G45_05570 [Lachnospiraceae bacterium]|nr:hypothetical protein [Lachnospiraceae bacterium]
MKNLNIIEDMKVLYGAFMSVKSNRKDEDFIIVRSDKDKTKKEKADHGRERR